MGWLVGEGACVLSNSFSSSSSIELVVVEVVDDEINDDCWSMIQNLRSELNLLLFGCCCCCC